MDFEWIFTASLWLPGAVLAGIVLIGLICQKKSFVAVLTGTFNAMYGYLLFCFGAKLITAVTAPIAQMVAASTGTRVVFASNEAAAAFCFSEYTLLTLGILAGGCALNILIARYTRYKVVFFTGHVLLFTAGMLAALMSALTAWPVWVMVLVGAVTGLGINLLSMKICQKYVERIPNGSAIALAHTGNVSVFLAGFLGSRFGKKENSAEDWNISKKWSFFRDASIASATTMTFVFFIIALLFGEGTNLGELGAFGYALKRGVLFAVSISVILLGIRFVTSDLTTTLKFFVDKLAPGSKLGVDAPLFFNFAPKSWLLAFLISYPLSLVFSWFFAGVVGLPCVAILCSVPCFFDAGIAGAVGNAVGGKRGVIIAAVAHALIMAVGASLVSAMVPLMQGVGVTWGGPDAAVFGTAFGYLLRFITGT